MGSIRPFNVKRTAEELADKFPNVFGDKFEENKKKLEKMMPDVSKRTINMIAGYITRYAVKKKEKAKREIEENSLN
ncbi:probable 30S ribosomal protein S17 [Thermoplasma acidophilum]|uniref:Small ribosomal subunit protein eS17 n=1 Tax=Thermoplasma acidophilum (strain ATCC 25905 / DSM 1728 / JCM 9062 / NBRC 15155 / AMRC-C165) TaxID=273075 RepID=RS17E_THEAC|nr:30S ribosomal protein S17e [Thermoplasma acidophilum]Q9HKK8.1 RecName: Full=Small ribosomal subunit protein eS17; AltName: Full=30S ribosomal protein S17e [Thermoplasma acidophilum DSM 1728]CAC11729.1 probable 30S ribosomal protein S17 [Thermoplasma acidophilum]